MIDKFRWTIIMTILTPLLIVVSIFLAGGGHGFYEPIIFLFPFSAISFIWFNKINFSFITMALLQYPIYGITIDSFRKKIKFISLYLFFLHLTIALIAYAIRPEQFK